LFLKVKSRCNDHTKKQSKPSCFVYPLLYLLGAHICRAAEGSDASQDAEDDGQDAESKSGEARSEDNHSQVCINMCA